MDQHLKDGDHDSAGDSGSAVEKSYRQIQDMVISFAIRPGERINESELSRKLGVSRTPLREALNRLASENFVDFVPAKGFYRKKVKPKEIFDLMQLRIAIETAAARLAVEKATPVQVAVLGKVLQDLADMRRLAPSGIIHKDELFHETLTGLSGNNEMLQALRSVNIRIRPLRYLAVDERRLELGQEQHIAIQDSLRRRDTKYLIELLEKHITRSLNDIERAVRELYGRIYLE
ncbi:GntR family transcriptional regulator [Ancylobacter sp. VNQ12]|uniref:GntR family transcriptional regulator n=1 Tax=Ancylobacter sp. VNQ12 TaxID=3400920 RepID=UPI003C071FCB